MGQSFSTAQIEEVAFSEPQYTTAEEAIMAAENHVKRELTTFLSQTISRLSATSSPEAARLSPFDQHIFVDHANLAEEVWRELCSRVGNFMTDEDRTNVTRFVVESLERNVRDDQENRLRKREILIRSTDLLDPTFDFHILVCTYAMNTRVRLNNTGLTFRHIHGVAYTVSPVNQAGGPLGMNAVPMRDIDLATMLSTDDWLSNFIVV